MAARVHWTTLAEVASAFPTGGAPAKDFRDYDENAGAGYDRVSTGTVPATLVIELELVPLQNFGVTITVATVARTIVAYGTEASGQVGVDFSAGLVAFHSSDDGLAYSVTFRGVGSGISATDLNTIQNEVTVLSGALGSYVVGPASATDHAAARYNLTTGKLVQDSLLIIADNGNTSTVGTLTGSNLSGTNTGDVTLGDTPTQNVFGLSGQALSLDVQTANLVFCGPTGGGAAAPTFRVFVDADLAGTNVAYTNVANIFTEAQSFNAGTSTEFDYEGSGAPTGVNLNSVDVNLNVDATGTYYTIRSWRSRTNGDVDINSINHRMKSTGTTVSISVDWPTVGGFAMLSAAAAAQGDLFFGSAAETISALAKDTNATRYLANTGTSNNPAWAQVNVANGVTGTLGVANGGTGATGTPTSGGIAYGGSSILNWSSAGTSGYLLASGGSGAPSFVEPYERILDVAPASTNIGASNKTFSVVAGTLAATGDEIVASFVYDGFNDPGDIAFAGSSIATILDYGGEISAVHVRIARTSNTAVMCVVELIPRAGATPDVTLVSLTSLDLAATAYDFTVTGGTTSGFVYLWKITKTRGA